MTRRLNHVIFMDHFVLEKVCDTAAEAERHLRNCRFKYQGVFTVQRLTDAALKQLLSTQDGPKFQMAIGNSYQSVRQ